MKDTFPPFQHVAIVGVGLLGASLGMALRQKKLAERVTGVGRSGSHSIEIALQRGAIDAATTDIAHAVRDADLVVLCVPVRQFAHSMHVMAPALPAGAIVTDVGSTKAQVMAWAREYLGPDVLFIGSHPMAGSDRSGPAAARATLYEQAVCLMCSPPPPTPPPPPTTPEASEATNDRWSSAYARVRHMWQAVGMRILECTPEVHDQWVATISHLPHALAAALVNAAAREPQTLEAIGTGFLDTTRLASGDIDMWTDIFLTNRAAVAGALEQFMSELRQLQTAVQSGDELAIRATLLQAQQTRKELLARRMSAGLRTTGGEGEG